MPSTHLDLHYHLVFSTKERRPTIADGWRERLHAYLGGLVRAVGGVPVAVGGTADHIHILAGLRATLRLADVLREVKGESSRWVHEELQFPVFASQEGYGRFTVGAREITGVRQYIASQPE